MVRALIWSIDLITVLYRLVLDCMHLSIYF